MPISIQDRTAYLLKRPPRPHPYAMVRHDARGQYYDFKSTPDLIETALEDFTPHSANPGVQQLYALIRHMNREGAPLETTDCGLSQKLHRSTNSPFPNKAGWTGGRLIFMWRDIDRNCDQTSVKWLLRQVLRYLKRSRTRHNYIGFVVGPFPTLFLSTGEKGYQVDIEYAMWGDSFEEAMDRFPEVVSVLDGSIRKSEAACEKNLPKAK